MSRPLLSVLLLPLLFVPAAMAEPGAAPADPLGAGLVAYRDEARVVVAALEAGGAPKEQAAAIQSLADRAVTLVEPFVARRPACADYLRAAAGLHLTWKTLSVETIERDYHQDAALPPIADPAAKAVCYQMKDLVVHPLTALRLLQDDAPDAAAVRHEIVEVAAHAQALAALTGAVSP